MQCIGDFDCIVTIMRPANTLLWRLQSFPFLASANQSNTRGEMGNDTLEPMFPGRDYSVGHVQWTPGTVRRGLRHSLLDKVDSVVCRVLFRTLAVLVLVVIVDLVARYLAAKVLCILPQRCVSLPIPAWGGYSYSGMGWGHFGFRLSPGVDPVRFLLWWKCNRH